MTTKTQWKTFGVNDLSAEQGKLLTTFLAAQKQAKEARIAMEASIVKAAGLPADKALVFAYNYGPAMAVIPAADVRRNSAKPKTTQSVTDFLASHR